MKLYSWGAAPNPRRVLIYMAEKGIEIPVVEAGEGAHLTDDYLSRYNGRIVPMLELDDGTQIGEAMAICRYLEEAYPAPPLFGVNRRDRAMVDMWERRAENEGGNGVAEVFRNSTPAFVGRGLPGFAESIEQLPDLVERGKKRLARFYGRIERQLADNRFLAGARFSVADITALCVVDFATRGAKVGLPEDHTNAWRWHAEVSARPSIAG